MIERKAKINNEQGIHCRPASVILKEMRDYEGDIYILTDNGEAKLLSVMGLLGLGLDKGRDITIRVEGSDEEEVSKRLVDLFEFNYDYPPRK